MVIRKTQLNVCGVTVNKEITETDNGDIDILWYPYSTFTETAVLKLMEEMQIKYQIKNNIKIIFEIGDFQTSTTVKNSKNIMSKIYNSLPSTSEVKNISIVGHKTESLQLIIKILA